MFIKDNKRLNIWAPYEAADGTRYGNLTDPAVRESLGVVEIPDPQPPEDYSDETYYRTEQDDAPYVVFTRKSDEQILAAKAARVQAEIESLETRHMLPRVVREYMLAHAEMVAQANGLNPMDNIGYRKVKELDTNIATLRSLLA